MAASLDRLRLSSQEPSPPRPAWPGPSSRRVSPSRSRATSRPGGRACRARSRAAGRAPAPGRGGACAAGCRSCRTRRRRPGKAAQVGRRRVVRAQPGARRVDDDRSRAGAAPARGPGPIAPTGIAPASGARCARSASRRERVRFTIQRAAHPARRHSTAAPRAAPPAPSSTTRAPRSPRPRSSRIAGREPVAVGVEAAPARPVAERACSPRPRRARPGRGPRPDPTASTLCGTVRLTPRNPRSRMRPSAARSPPGSTSNGKYRQPAKRASSRASSARAALCICGLTEWPTGWPITASPVPACGQRSRSDSVRAGFRAAGTARASPRIRRRTPRRSARGRGRSRPSSGSRGCGSCGRAPRGSWSGARSEGLGEMWFERSRANTSSASLKRPWSKGSMKNGTSSA